MKNQKSAIIVGAGLAGSLWAVYLAKAGYKVTVYERRSDIRNAEISAGKSINLALSTRGWKALKKVGVDEKIQDLAIPMTGRIMHSIEGELTYQPYGKEDQAIYSISRGGLNIRMMDIADESEDVQLFYDHQCVGVNLEEGTVKLKNRVTNEATTDQADVVFACDGAYSAVRYKGMQKEDRFDFSQDYIDDGYREILLPANSDGSYKLEKNALHIWPRGKFMLIALPNEDGTFTCTLFMPYSGDGYSFEKLTSKDKVNAFFAEIFPDFYEMMPEIGDSWEDHPLSSLCIMRSYPWNAGKAVLMGDAAHATVPFYGQGMNASFEDCTVMGNLMEEFNEDWEQILPEFSKRRKKDGDALQDLSLYNYYVMRDYVGDAKFLLRKKIEAKFSQLYPEKWLPLYSQVTFSEIPYSEALANGKKQTKIMDVIMETPDIENCWDSDEIMKKLNDLI